MLVAIKLVVATAATSVNHAQFASFRPDLVIHRTRDGNHSRVVQHLCLCVVDRPRELWRLAWRLDVKIPAGLVHEPDKFVPEDGVLVAVIPRIRLDARRRFNERLAGGRWLGWWHGDFWFDPSFFNGVTGVLSHMGTHCQHKITLFVEIVFSLVVIPTKIDVSRLPFAKPRG